MKTNMLVLASVPQCSHTSIWSHSLHTVHHCAYVIVVTAESKKLKQILSIFIRWPWPMGTAILFMCGLLLMSYLCVHKIDTQEVKNFNQIFAKISNINFDIFRAHYANMDATRDATSILGIFLMCTPIIHAIPGKPAHQYHGWPVLHSVLPYKL